MNSSGNGHSVVMRGSDLEELVPQRAGKLMPEHDRERVSSIADEALRRIRTLGLSPDPSNFEFWYTYVAGNNHALNSAVNALMAGGAVPSPGDLQALYDRYLSPARLVEQLRPIRESLQERTSKVADVITAASPLADGYSEELANAAPELQQIEHRNALASTISALLQSTEDMRKANAQLQTELSASVLQVRQLQERLEAIQFERKLDPLTSVANGKPSDLPLMRTNARSGSSVVRLVWQEAFECGEPTIDRQHHELFELANVLLDGFFNSEVSPQAFRAAREKLMAQIVQHFADEEAVLARHGYKDLETHRRAHAQLMAEAEKLKALIACGKTTLGDLVEFLADTLVVRHMLKLDRDFFPLFKKGDRGEAAFSS